MSLVFMGSARLHVALRTAAACRGCARLNRFHKIAADAMFELDGTFAKAVGDQAMAFFGVPFRPEDHAQEPSLPPSGSSKLSKI